MRNNSRLYFNYTRGAYGGSLKGAPEFLEVKVTHRFSYATTPGFGPGYVNTSAVLIDFYSAKVLRDLTPAEETELAMYMQNKQKFADRAAMYVDIHETRATAKVCHAREEREWKQKETRAARSVAAQSARLAAHYA